MKKSLPRLPMLALLVGCLSHSAVEGREETAAAATTASPSTATTLAATMQVPIPSAASTEANDRPSGNQLLASAARNLERRASVSAKLRHQIAVSGQTLYGVGGYWQQGSGEDLKVRLELQIAGQDATLLQVCNSRFSWIDRRLPTGRTVSRIDLRQLRADPSLVSSNLSEIKPGQASWSAISPELTTYMGGLPFMLASLDENFAFLPPQAMRLAIATQPGEEPLTTSVYAVVGQWKPERLAALLAKVQADGQPAPAEKSKNPNHKKKLPDRMPEEVLLLVGQADLFPYRIEYRKLETPQAFGADGPTIPYQLSVHPMIVLEYSELVFDAPIAAGQFDYAPGDADFEDLTTSILERLRHERQSQVAARPTAEAAAPARQ